MSENFNAKRISRTATIFIHSTIENVFPLFGPIEEKKWAYGWDPIIIFPKSNTVEKNMLFKTKGQGFGEDEFIWNISQYQPEKYSIEYTVHTANRIWTIFIKCLEENGQTTQATITYTFTGLNSKGNAINEKLLAKMYESDLKDWEKALNHFLETGNILN